MLNAKIFFLKSLAILCATLPPRSWPAIKNFLKFTFSVIKRGNVHEVASVFTFGREDLIPDMFIPLIEGINAENNDLNKLIYYFKRHIEVDGDKHGPMSMEMLSYLCDNDPIKISESLIQFITLSSI